MGAAADDMNRINRTATELTQPIEDHPVAEGQTFQGGADRSAIGLGDGLSAAPAEFPDRCGHVGWCDKVSVVGIDQRTQGWRCGG